MIFYFNTLIWIKHKKITFIDKNKIFSKKKYIAFFRKLIKSHTENNVIGLKNLNLNYTRTIMFKVIPTTKFLWILQNQDQEKYPDKWNPNILISCFYAWFSFAYRPKSGSKCGKANE